jgi:hypothetical protein
MPGVRITPLGWLWTSNSPAAFDNNAALNTSRGWTIAASSVPVETTWTPIKSCFVVRCRASTVSTVASASSALASTAASRGVVSLPIAEIGRLRRVGA